LGHSRSIALADKDHRRVTIERFLGEDGARLAEMDNHGDLCRIDARLDQRGTGPLHGLLPAQAGLTARHTVFVVIAGLIEDMDQDHPLDLLVYPGQQQCRLGHRFLAGRRGVDTDQCSGKRRLLGRSRRAVDQVDRRPGMPVE